MSQKSTVQGYLLSIASCFVIIAGMREASSLVVTFLLAFFVAIILTPGLRWLQARRVSTPVALLVIIAFVGTIGGGVVAVVGQSANQLVQQLPSYQLQLQSKANEIEDWISDQAWAEWLLERKIDDATNNGLEPTEAESGNAAPGGEDEDKDESGDSTKAQPNTSESGEGEPISGDNKPNDDERLDAETRGDPSNAHSPADTPADNTTSDNTTSDNTTSDNTTSDNTTSDNTTADNTPSDNTAADLASDKAASSGDDDPLANPEAVDPEDPENNKPVEVDPSTEGVFTPTFDSPSRNNNNAMATTAKPENVSQLLSLEPADAVELMKRLLADLGGLFSSAFLILLTVIFILLETARFPAKLQAAVGGRGGASEHIREMVDNIRRYMFIKTSTSLLTGLLVTAVLLTFDVRYAMLWGLLAFLFNYVPNIGSILAAGPAVALVFIEQGITPAIMIGIAYLIINFFVSYAIEPRFMGQGLGLSTLVVFLSLIFWGWVLGPIGMLLSAPLTMIVKIILADFEETRWIAVMLSAKAPAPVDESE